MVTKVVINLPNAKDVVGKFGLGTNGEVQKFFTNEVWRATLKYVPFDQGYLSNSSRISNDGTSITYEMPYARRLYFSQGYNFKGAPIRGAKWVDRGFNNNQRAILKAVNRFIKQRS